MNTVIWTALALVALVAASTWMTAWSRRDTWARPAAVLLFILAIPVIGAAMAETLGRHKPIELAWDLPTGDYHVLAAKMIQDRAIYIYVNDPEREEPRPLALPWSNEMADKIQKAMDGAPEGAEGQFVLRYDQSLATEFSAHALPQQAQPPAKDEPEPGLTFQQ